tara:strand:+ start:109 stop:396 length:288 start_codon:yes stop_codon:yes gene_type:complete
MKFLLLIVLIFLCSHVDAATCVTADINDFLILTNQSIADCTSLVLLSKDEFILSTSFTDIFAMSQSDYEQFAQAFLLLLSLALTIKVVMRQLMPK